MSKYCSVPNCTSWKKKHPEISFHSFPTSGKVLIINEFGAKTYIDRRKAWILKLGIKKTVTKAMIVCSRHFTTDDYFYRDPNSSKKRKCNLKQNAIPSKNLPMKQAISTEPTLKLERMKKSVPIREEISAESDEVSVCLEPTEKEFQAAEGLIQLLNSQPNYDRPKQFRDFEVQVNMPKPSTLCDLLNTNAALNSFTGIHNMELLHTIVEAVQSVYSDTRSHRLSIKERIVLLFTKLKCNLSYITLSILFSISQELCRTYILDMLPIVSKALESCIRFPDASEVRRNMSKCFKEFENSRVVLDCTDIIVEKSKC